MEIASAPRERSDGGNGVFVAAWIAGCASGDDVTIQSGERREAPRKDAAIREHETPARVRFVFTDRGVLPSGCLRQPTRRTESRASLWLCGSVVAFASKGPPALARTCEKFTLFD